VNKIVLTDWPKFRYTKANYRGMETERLLELRKSLYHTMMNGTAEQAGGWVVNIDLDGIIEELTFRKALPKDGWNVQGELK